MVAVVRDTTERHRAQAALRESEARYRALFEQAAVPVALVEPGTWRLVDVNESGCRTLGYSREDLLGMDNDAVDIHFWAHQQQIVDALARAGELPSRPSIGPGMFGA